MSIVNVNVASGLDVAPEIRRAMESINLPQVQEMLRKLSEFGLGICIPHQHTEDMDFDYQPDDVVQVEENCHVRWVARSDFESGGQFVPVAWRWSEAKNGALAAGKCISGCSYSNDPKKSHKKFHMPG